MSSSRGSGVAPRRSLWRRLRRATRGPRNALLAGAITLVGRLFALLPLGAGLAIGRVLGKAAVRLLGQPRRFADAHVAIAFPELDAGARAKLVQSTFVHAGQSFAELAMIDAVVRRPGYVAFESGSQAVMDEALAAGGGVLAVSGHCGNWELLAAWIATIGYPLTVVVRVNDLRLHSLIMRFRTAAGIELVVRDAPNFLSGVREALARNRVVAILIDQDTRGAGVYVPFFGRLAHTPPGAALLALRSGAPLITTFIARRPEGGHAVRMAPVDVSDLRGRDTVVRLTARLTAAIEAQIRRAPAEWVWWHERWRRQPPVTSEARGEVARRRIAASTPVNFTG